ncbi:MAG TPA: LysR substrate-binding domain-containing protein, partial [Trinickia sp.]|uniref:LysR family transcriptional regulator n=1 Tax=Trinickia sp. TaxID=2571163 RepID=UPI002CBA60C8
LEDRLDTRLLNRTTRSVSLTEAGSLYLERARQILDDIQQLDQSVATGSGEFSGELRIAASVSLDVKAVLPAVQSYVTQHPKVVPHLFFVDDSVDPAEEGVDIGIALQTASESAVTQRLVSCPRVVCATPSYLDKHGVPTHPVELAEHACLSLSSESADRYVFTSIADKIQASPTSILVTNNPPMLHQFALCGLGIAILPAYMVADEIIRGDLVQVLPDYQLPHFEMNVTYPRHRAANGKIRSFISHLVKHFDREWINTVSDAPINATRPMADPLQHEEEEAEEAALC